MFTAFAGIIAMVDKSVAAKGLMALEESVQIARNIEPP
jgi:hypothetical protein